MIFLKRFLWVFGLVCGGVVCLLFSSFVHAAESSVRITEIMYDAEGKDEGKEFIEVINVGPGAIDMTTVDFFERADRYNGRPITQSKGSALLQPGEVAVLVANPELFLQHYAFDGVLLDTSTFALLNTGSTVSLERAGVVLHDVSYSSQDGAKGDGASLHVAQDGTITARLPTLGVARGIRVKDSGGVVTDTPASDDAQAPAQHQQADEVRFVSRPSVVFSASTTDFSVVRTAEDGSDEVLYGLWNFGDGAYEYGAAVEHMYLYPGAYIVVFQEVVEGDEPGIALQQEVSVLFPQVGVEWMNDAFVRLHNRHPFLLDVSGWQIVSNGSFFTFPEHSLVSAQDSIVVSFSAKPEDDLFFVTAGGGQFSGSHGMPTSPVPSPTEDSAQEAEQPVAVTERSDDEEMRGVFTGGGVKRSAASQEGDARTEEAGIDQKRKVVVWIALLLGIMLVAVAPFLIVRDEKKRK